MRVQLFGVPSFTTSTGEVRLRPKVRRIAAYLFMHSGQYMARAGLADVFWPESDEVHAAASLRNALHTLQCAFDGAGERGVLHINRDTVAVQHSAIEVDVHRFRRAVCSGLGEAQGADVSDLIGAVPLYLGDFLADGYEGSPAEEAWAAFERRSLRELYIAALSTLVRHFSESNLPHAALSYGVRWRETDPWNEEASRALMRLYAHTGQPALAGEEYERLHAELESELGVTPGEATVNTWKETSRGAARKPMRSLYPPAPPPTPQLSADSRRNAALLTLFGEQKIFAGESEEGLEALGRACAAFEASKDRDEARRTRLTAAGALLRNVVAPRPDLALTEVMPLVEQYKAEESGDLPRALLIAADALQYCFSYTQSADLAREGARLARLAGNRELETRFELVRGIALAGACEFDEATEAVERAIPALATLGEPREMMRAMTTRGILAMLNEAWTDAEQYLVEAIAIAARLPKAPAIMFEEGYARGMLIIIMWGLERYEEARALAMDRGFDLGAAPGGDILMAICLPNGDKVASARAAAGMVRATLRTLGGWPGAGYSRLMWQEFNLYGMHREALPWSAMSIRLSRTSGLKIYEASGYSTRGITQAQLGNLKAAEYCLCRARELTGTGPFFAVGYLKNLEGLVARAKGDFAAARRSFDEAIETWRGSGEVHFVRLIKEEIARLPEPYRC